MFRQVAPNGIAFSPVKTYTTTIQLTFLAWPGDDFYAQNHPIDRVAI